MNNRLDDLLRQTLRTRAADQGAACLDAEGAASWVDGSMPARARVEAEAHLADCPRCQAMLAALIRTTPPPRARVWWRRPAMAWLTPLAVAATALAVWINVSDEAGLAPAQVAREDEKPAAAPPPADPQAVPENRDRRAEPSARASEPRAAGASALAAKARQNVPPPPSPVAEPAPPPPSPAAMPPNAGPVASPPIDATAARSEFRAADRSALAETRSVATRVRARAAPTIIVSSNGTSRWQIGVDGQLQHSADGGVTWQAQTTGVDAAADAGSSPSPAVCWLVGGAGLVLVTTDEGRSWRRVPFPAAVDLVSIRATDDQRAAVVASDGRTFETLDGGKSWRP
jgi:hypothetical protein